MHRLLAITALWVMAACVSDPEVEDVGPIGPVGPAPRDTEDEPDETPGRDVLVMSIDFGCINQTGAEVDVEFDGWVEGVVIDTQMTDGTVGSGQYTAPASDNVDFCDDGTCDWWTSLIRVDDLAAPCGDFGLSATQRWENVAVRIQAEPASNNFSVECAIFGRGSRDAYGDDCVCTEAWLQTPPSDPCGD